MTDSCKKTAPTILHVDMDHFFSAVEEREHPEFKGHPVVVGGDPHAGHGRGVVKTCNYEARAFGIHSDMPISQAWRRCPDAIFVRGHYPLYKEVSSQIMAILRKHADKFQPWGLDEAFLDISAQVHHLEDAVELAISIKHEILWSVQLTCSIGVAPNKLVAKIASDFQKPDGLTVVPDENVPRFLAPLPVRKMLWIGEKTANKLHAMGIYTIGDLAASDVSMLTECFGVMGARYHQYAQGIYSSEVGGDRQRKSVGSERTFADDVNDYTLILHRLDALCQKIHQRTVKRHLLFKTVTLKVRYHDFQTHTHARTLPLFTDRLEDLQKTVHRLMQDCLRRDKRTRLVGVRVSQLTSRDQQRTLA